jgi:DNA-binding LacI/PurR family transcriptional regulator
MCSYSGAMGRKTDIGGSRQRVTSFDVAVAAGVSQPTVSRALRADPAVSPETRERVLEAARALDYTIDSRAARLRSGSTRTLAVVILTASGQPRARVNPFYFAVLGAIGAAASDRGFHLLLSFQDSQAGFRSDYQKAQEADGLIVLGSAGQADGWAHFAKAFEQGANIVAWGAPSAQLPTVRCDNPAGGALVARHLAGRDRRRIAFVGPGWERHLAFRQRREGFRAALEGLGLEPLEAPDRGGGSREEQGEAAVAALLASGDRPDAIFAATDLLAIGAARALRGAGLSVPKDVAIVGFDGIPSAAHASPALSTVEQDSEVAGQLLVEALLDQGAGRALTGIPIPVRLVARESSASAD